MFRWLDNSRPIDCSIDSVNQAWNDPANAETKHEVLEAATLLFKECHSSGLEEMYPYTYNHERHYESYSLQDLTSSITNANEWVSSVDIQQVERPTSDSRYFIRRHCWYEFVVAEKLTWESRNLCESSTADQMTRVVNLSHLYHAILRCKDIEDDSTLVDRSGIDERINDYRAAIDAVAHWNDICRKDEPSSVALNPKCV